MKLTIFVLAAVFCMAHSNPVPLPEESIDLINIPLQDNKVSKLLFYQNYCVRIVPRSSESSLNIIP
jgi:hypothetical protein